MTATAPTLAALVLVTLTVGSLRGAARCTVAAHARRRRLLPAGHPTAGGPLEADVPGRLRPLLEDAALPLEPAAAWRLWARGEVALVVLAILAAGPAGAVLVGLGWVALAAVALLLRRGAAARAVEAALPGALEAIARSLRGGAGTHQALTEVARATHGPLGGELDRVCADLRGGRSLGQALRSLEARRPLHGVRLTVAALLLGSEAGGAHARALEGVAEGVRARLAVGAEVRALASQARLSALVIAAAPVAFGLLAAGTDAATASFLLGTPLGLACLVLGLGLDAVGALWMRRITEVER